MLAALTGVAAINLDKSEAEQLASAGARVLAHYDVPDIAPKTVDWINLCQVVGVIYGTRIMAARIAAKAKGPATPPEKPVAQEVRRPNDPPLATPASSPIRSPGEAVRPTIVSNPGLPPIDMSQARQ